MAEWNKGKVLPSAINGGQEFTKKDNLAVNELNAIVNNSFYASEKSERAERLAESAVKGNGTLVTIGGQFQGEWSADFVEAERQKSRNLWAYGDVSATRWTDVHLKKPLTAGTYTFSAVVTNTDTASNYSLVEFYDESNIQIMQSGILKNERASFEFTLSRDCYRVSFIGNDSGTAGIDFTYTDIMITTDGSTDYQPYNGAIVHEKELNKRNITLLWENTRANIYEDFNPQTITLASADYDCLIVLWSGVSNDPRLMSTIIYKGKGAFLNWAYEGSNTYSREVNYTNDTTLTCMDAKINSGTIENLYCVPYKILGFKLN